MKKTVLIGYDGSLRSSGISTLDLEGNLVDFSVVAGLPKDYKDEELLEYNRDELSKYITKTQEKYNLKFLWYERAAFAANSAVKDKIAGQFWLNRIMLKKMNVDWNVVSVGTWRKELVPKKLREEWKKQCPGITLKEINVKVKQYPIEKLPTDVVEKFENFISTDKKYKKAISDLADSYWIAKWGLLQ